MTDTMHKQVVAYAARALFHTIAMHGPVGLPEGRYRQTYSALGEPQLDTMTGEKFVNERTLIIIAMGLVAFVLDTAGGVMSAKLLNLFLPKDRRINPMVGAAGISAFPMSARVIQKLGQQADRTNHLLMHAVGANVSGQIGSVLAGGILLAFLGG